LEGVGFHGFDFESLSVTDDGSAVRGAKIDQHYVEAIAKVDAGVGLADRLVF
jgi:hypothetical protein